MLKIVNNKKALRVTAGILVVLLFVILYFLLVKNDNAQDQGDGNLEIIQASNESSVDLAEQEKYEDSARELEKSYREYKEEADKAIAAYDIGKLYQSDENYSKAREWMQLAISHFNAAGDPEGAEEVQQAINGMADLEKLPTDPNGPTENEIPEELQTG